MLKARAIEKFLNQVVDDEHVTGVMLFNKDGEYKIMKQNDFKAKIDQFRSKFFKFASEWKESLVRSETPLN